MTASSALAFVQRLSRGAGALAVVAVVALALGRVHVRVQTTLTGYEIGRLKNNEARQLEERSNLRMQLAKLTTKKHLLMISESGDHPSDEPRTVASNQ